MGQQTFYMITTDELEVHINIIHFKEKNAIVFPLLLEDGDYERSMCELAEDKSLTLYLYLDILLHGGYSLEYPMKVLFNFLQSTQVKSIAIIACREILESPYDLGGPIVFVNETIVSDKSSQIHPQNAHELIGAEVSNEEIISNEAKYYHYLDSEIYYLESLKNHKAEASNTHTSQASESKNLFNPFK